VYIATVGKYREVEVGNIDRDDKGKKSMYNSCKTGTLKTKIK
jgi:hypothetical protein